MIQSRSFSTDTLPPLQLEDFDSATAMWVEAQSAADADPGGFAWSTQVISSQSVANTTDDGTALPTLELAEAEKITPIESVVDSAVEMESAAVPSESDSDSARRPGKGLHRITPRNDTGVGRRSKGRGNSRRRKKKARQKSESPAVTPLESVSCSSVESVPAETVETLSSEADTSPADTDPFGVAEASNDALESTDVTVAVDSATSDTDSQLDQQQPVEENAEQGDKQNAAQETEQNTEQENQQNTEQNSAALPSVAFSLAEPQPQQEERYADWFRRVIIRNKWMTWFTTFYLHWLLVLILAAIIVHGPQNTASLLINATFAEEEELEPPAFEVVPAEPEPLPDPVEEPAPKEESPALAETDLAMDEAVLEELVPEGIPTPAEEASEAPVETPKTAVPAQAPVVNPAPPQAIVQGSFSVWTEPSQPLAGEPYRIVIQIRLPKGVSRYNADDLQGVVAGSDGYRKPVPGSVRGFLPIQNGYTRLIVPIVSADEKVRDTVFIRSRMLKETQKLLIEF